VIHVPKQTRALSLLVWPISQLNLLFRWTIRHPIKNHKVLTSVLKFKRHYAVMPFLPFPPYKELCHPATIYPYIFSISNTRCMPQRASLVFVRYMVHSCSLPWIFPHLHVDTRHDKCSAQGKSSDTPCDFIFHNERFTLCQPRITLFIM